MHTVTGHPAPLPADTEATVYRIVQEALTNVVRHARASRVGVELCHAPDGLTVTVTDDGRRPGTTTGLRLVGIRERAAAHGGTAVCGAGPDGVGFQVLVELPLVTSPTEVGR
ncbi:sensor histidine kinase [Streptomyces sp. NPDC060030]|uniref:sensor histidine kinase n=1 Tax=Streptomyces sp. NPDC060030 TaxID=3347042 RepID=UPI0036748228